MCLPLASHALAYTSYDDGTMSTTYVTYFEDIVDTLPIGHSYVASRTGQYEYILCSSDSLKYDLNGGFVADESTIYTFTVASGYNSSYSYSVRVVDSFELDTSGMMVYSNLGDYPSLDDRGSVYEYALLLAFVVGGICCLIRPIFKYVLRIR